MLNLGQSLHHILLMKVISFFIMSHRLGSAKVLRFFSFRLWRGYWLLSFLHWRATFVKNDLRKTFLKATQHPWHLLFQSHFVSELRRLTLAVQSFIRRHVQLLVYSPLDWAHTLCLGKNYSSNRSFCASEVSRSQAFPQFYSLSCFDYLWLRTTEWSKASFRVESTLLAAFLMFWAVFVFQRIQSNF